MKKIIVLWQHVATLLVVINKNTQIIIDIFIFIDENILGSNNKYMLHEIFI